MRRQVTGIHDRFLMVDDISLILGQSIKDAGNKPTYLIKIESCELFRKAFDELWNNASPLI